MVATVEISMYPFQENYKDLIKSFIAKLKEKPDLRVVPGPTSTVVIGEFAHVTKSLAEMMEWSYGQQGRSVFVTKTILDYDAS